MGRKKIRYDKEFDILDISLDSKSKIEGSRELRNLDVIFDFNKEGEILGLEIYDFGRAFKESQKEIDKIFKKSNKRKKK